MKKCNGKICFSEAQASRRVGRYDDIKRYYQCRFCNTYHLTSKDNWVTKQVQNVTESEVARRISQLQKLITR